MRDLISRQAAIGTVHKIIYGLFSEKDGVMTDTEKTLLSVNKAICNGVRALPSAQPERTDCTDCPEYDHKTHYCPKYCRVIRQTLEEAKQERTGRWIFKDDRRIVDGYDWQCDKCGSYQRYTSNYCPRCGARMEGEG